MEENPSFYGCRQLELTGKDTRFNDHISLANINEWYA